MSPGRAATAYAPAVFTIPQMLQVTRSNRKCNMVYNAVVLA